MPIYMAAALVIWGAVAGLMSLAMLCGAAFGRERSGTTVFLCVLMTAMFATYVVAATLGLLA